MIYHKYNIGDRLQDKVSGYTGIVSGITKYATGCIHYGLAAEHVKENKIPDWQWFDEGQLKLVKESVVKFEFRKDNYGQKKIRSAPGHNPPGMNTQR